jgi:hypothetical protein
MKKDRVFFLVFLFLVSVLIFMNFGNVFTGMAGGGIGGCPCGDGTPANTCVVDNAPNYCNEIEIDNCAIQQACEVCGCPSEEFCFPGLGASGLGTCSINSCGNDEIDGDDVCEGEDLGGATCESLGFSGGSLSCDECGYVTSSCIENDCGNGAIDSGEECDGNNFGGSSCNSLGYDSGSLNCVDCSIIDAGCKYDGSDEDSSDEVEKNCASVNGVCTDSCFSGYVYYNNSNYDTKCENTYGEGLVCCIPDYSSSDDTSGEEIDDSKNKESTSIVGVEKFIIENGEENEIQKSPVNEYKGVQKILMSPSYAMGGVWIVFALTLFVVGISFYLHRKIYK